VVDRADIPISPTEKFPSPGERGAMAIERAIFFWMMVNIAAKNIARGQSWAALGHITAIRLALEEVRWHIGARATRPDYKLVKGFIAPPVASADQLAFVRRLAHEMAALHPRIAALGGHAPDEVVKPTFAFLDHAESLMFT
jgi:hypothetical protein